MAHNEPHRSEFESEMKARIKEDDVEPASRKDDWFYYTRTETGSEYEIHCRRKVWPLLDPHQRQACAWAHIPRFPPAPPLPFCNRDLLVGRRWVITLLHHTM
jgi:hypothetical protein